VGRLEDNIEVPEGTSLAELLVHVASGLSREAAGYVLTPAGELQPSLLVAVNNRAVPTHEAHDVRVHTGDLVMIMPPIAGG
jgi:sulfur carrier protein ThiS